MRGYSRYHGCWATGFAWTCCQQRWFHWGVIPTEDIHHVHIILSPLQSITDIAHHYSTYESGAIYSTGIGIEWEVVLNLFWQFKVQDAQLFPPTIDGYATLATSLTLATLWHVAAALTASLQHCWIHWHCTSSPMIAIFTQFIPLFSLIGTLPLSKLLATGLTWVQTGIQDPSKAIL